MIEIQETRVKDVTYNLCGGIDDYDDYEDFFKMMATLSENDTLTVMLNTPGGRCDIGFHIAHKLLACPCPVQMIVEYPTCSMGAIIALCGDALAFVEDSYIMFHDYSGGFGGKGEETLQHSVNFRKVFRAKFERLCKPFLTQAECDKMFKGEDIYIHDTDKSLESRMASHFPDMQIEKKPKKKKKKATKKKDTKKAAK